MLTPINQFPSSLSTYQQPHVAEPYWTPEPTIQQSYQNPPGPEPSILNPQYDFNSLASDIFQPEEMFQLDQPVKPDFVAMNQTEIARSPPTLLDLGSGTIHKEFKNEEYWHPALHNMLNDDSNNSSNSRFNLNQSPDSSHLLGITNEAPVDQHLYLETKSTDPLFTLQKNHFYPQCTIDNYPLHFDMVDSKPHFLDEKNGQKFESSHSKAYSKSNYQDEYIDLVQYNEYHNFLNVYDTSKTNNDNIIFNELDFRVNSCVPNISNVNSYSNDNFDVISYQ